jgi:tRNA(fMet)-specific endonuclease VapC
VVTLAFLLDTNVISEPLRPIPNEKLLARIREHENRLAIPSVVWHELLYGMARLPESRRRTAIEQYLFEVVRPTIPILPYDEHAARWHASERVRLTTLGRPLSFADGQIAAIATVEGLTLVTANTADFTPFEGVEIVNWLV